MSDNQNLLTEERKNNLDDSKNVEFYSQAAAAWFNSALEHDKSLLTLSVAGIGVLVSLMQSAIDSVSSLLMYIAAVLSFMCCLVFVLLIFNKNKNHIVDVLNGKVVNDKTLQFLDNSASCSFFLAMLFSVLLGISTAITTFSEKGKKMGNENTSDKNSPAIGGGHGNLNYSNESFNTMADLQKSMNGMSQLQQVISNQSQTTTGNQNQQPSSIGGSPSTNTK